MSYDKPQALSLETPKTLLVNTDIPGLFQDRGGIKGTINRVLKLEKRFFLAALSLRAISVAPTIVTLCYVHRFETTQTGIEFSFSHEHRCQIPVDPIDNTDWHDDPTFVDTYEVFGLLEIPHFPGRLGSLKEFHQVQKEIA